MSAAVAVGDRVRLVRDGGPVRTGTVVAVRPTPRGAALRVRVRGEEVGVRLPSRTVRLTVLDPPAPAASRPVRAAEAVRAASPPPPLVPAAPSPSAPPTPAAPAARVCSAPSCPHPGARAWARGWCNSCYQRWYAAGRPESGPPPPRRAKARRLGLYIAARDAGSAPAAAAEAAGLVANNRSIDRYEAAYRQALAARPQRTAVTAAWASGAACRTVDPEVFFADEGRALAICRTCPVRAACLEAALEYGEEHGVWGGTTPQQRAALRAAQELAA
ncbi:WhiB family transcriptional regulator [Allonocardiopsis opalescens]|uniref:Transcriptional regulator WhiB n=1 Tax=Allonocardiopsis opalescens TaxID=1144618 RepID=A0A2T0PVP5_9ACTN|nr:WhiB family transcriptional regulator [Allonocardiopsis opalescens]PRX95603.1 transcription factor WhiB [Allonocardiopsis opalescens]